jgi:hypothetical protein
MFYICIGSESEFVKLVLPYRSEEWIETNVSIAVQGFTGSLNAFFDVRDFVSFENELQTLYQNLQGTATLQPLEEQVLLTLVGNGKGGITMNGIARSSFENQLEFMIELDQTFIPEILMQLQLITRSSNE